MTQAVDSVRERPAESRTCRVAIAAAAPAITTALVRFATRTARRFFSSARARVAIAAQPKSIAISTARIVAGSSAHAATPMCERSTSVGTSAR